jgi:hypothetical protein
VTIGANGPVFGELKLGDEENGDAWPLLVRGPLVSSHAASLLGAAPSNGWRDTGWRGRAAADGHLEVLQSSDAAPRRDRLSIGVPAKAA